MPTLFQSTPAYNVLLLENISQTAVEMLESSNFNVDRHAKALPEEVLVEKIRTAHIVGIRSKTQLTEHVLSHAQNLLAIGCFCIGTNQVDLTAAAERGIPVFNSPFSNSRSVAELVIGYIISLARQLGDRNREVHSGTWNKVSTGCYEIRGKTLGIVGYGHIGTQLSVLAEAMGLRVMFYDILQIMPLAHSRPVSSLEQVLAESHFVTLHVPETPETRDMIGERELQMMQPGSYLINASRGSVVDVDALARALRSGHLAGAAVDVYPKEPFKNGEGFESPLLGCPNTILTPHIGGSTEEAQVAIGREVASALIKYARQGTTLGAVNFPEADLRVNGKRVARVLHVHHNVPGVLRQVNEIVGGRNVEKQICDNKGDLAYLMMDISVTDDDDLERIKTHVEGTDGSIKTRILT